MRIRSDFLEDGMNSIPFRKTPLVTITVLSSVTLALFAGPAAAEPLATFRVAQDTANPVAPPNLTPEQKKKLEDLKRLREQGNKPPEKPPVSVKPPVAPKLVNPPPVVKPAAPVVVPKAVVVPPKPPVPPVPPCWCGRG